VAETEQAAIAELLQTSMANGSGIAWRMAAIPATRGGERRQARRRGTQIGRGKAKTTGTERRDGILQITVHTEGGPLKWSMPAHAELGYAFAEISRDDENKVVIITGTGDIYCSELDMGRNLVQMTTDKWDHIYKDAKHLLMNLLDIEVLVIEAGQWSRVDPCGNPGALGHRDLLGKRGVPPRAWE
jgi:hypothetical protein